MKKLGLLGWIAFILLFLGGINWGLIGLFNFNAMEAIFGLTIFTKFIYVLIGISAIFMLAAVSMPTGYDRRTVGRDPLHQKPLNDRRRRDRRHVESPGEDEAEDEDFPRK